MSNENPELQSPPPPHPDEALQPTSPDFRETPDLEPLAPENDRFPIWLYLICGVALFLAGSSFTGFSYFGRGLLDQGPGGPAVASAGSQAEPLPSAADLGKKLYEQNCANCHQKSGIGQPGSYPPLAGSEWVLGSKERLSAIMLAGVAGPITVKGGQYGTQVMPGWSTNFTPEKLADIMTYLRSSWGNTAGPVTADDIAAAKTKLGAALGSPCSEASLLAIAPHGPDPTDKK
jgi:mono/diheme cytochrome c family protein